MKKIGIALAALGLATVGLAQQQLYSPVRSAADQKIGFRGWGSGTVAETDEMAYEGTHSIRISSRNFFQGGFIIFVSPVDLSAPFSNANNMLRVTFNAPDASATMGGGTPGGAPGKKGGGAIGGTGGPGGPGGTGPQRGGEDDPNSRGGGKTGSASAGPSTPLTMMRLVVTTTDGKKSETYVAISTGTGGDRGWKQFSIPLQGITGLGNTNKQIQSIAFAGDSAATFYIGDLRVINDTTPISGELRINRTNLALGDELTLIGYGNGGSSVLKYEWDFDSDGQVDAEGQAIKRKFRKPGDINITLMISDKYGLKKPYKTTVKVKVNP